MCPLNEFIATFDDYVTALEAGTHVTEKYKVNQSLIKVDPALKSHIISLNSAAPNGGDSQVNQDPADLRQEIWICGNGSAVSALVENRTRIERDAPTGRPEGSSPVARSKMW